MATAGPAPGGQPVMYGSHHVEKLTGVSNYTSWKFTMRMLLILEGLWGVIEGTDADAARDQRALARICLAVSSSLIQYVRNATTAKEAWQKLEKVLDDKGLYRRVLFLRQLHRIDFNSFANMNEYIENVMLLVQKLADIGRTIEDDEVAEILLSGLPTEYDALVSNMETIGIGTTLTSEMVRSRLLQEEHRKITTSGVTGDSNMAFATKKVCHYCNRPGHIKSKCFKRRRDEQNKKKKGESQTLAVTETAFCTTSDWIVDSGCSSHMMNDKKHLKDFRQSVGQVCVANNNKIDCVGRGNITLLLNKKVKCNISDIMYVPLLSTNLLSVAKITEKGHQVVFDKTECNIFNSRGKCIANGKKVNGVYRLNGVISGCNETCPQVQNKTVHSAPLQNELQRASSAKETAVPAVSVWHSRLGHLGYGGMCALRDNNSIMFQGELEVCVPCLEGKQAARPFPVREAKRTSQPLELIHSDVCGPMSVCSWGGARYLVAFTDDFTRKTYAYLMKNKSEVMSFFLTFKALVEKQTGLPIKCLRSDGGKEYCNERFSTYLKSEGIVHQVTVPYCPQQNGVSERLNRTLMEKARCMLQNSGLCQQYWGEAVMTAVYLKNRSPTSALAGRIPEEVWTCSRIDLGHLRVFGCIAYSRVPTQKRTKLEAKSKMHIFVGYSECTKGYRLADPSDPRDRKSVV